MSDLTGAKSSAANWQDERVQDLTRLAVDARDGERPALELFVRSIQADVWRFCVHLTSADEADDLAQESLLRIVAHLQRWERGPVMSWALGVTRNVCYEHLRRRTRRRTTPAADPAHDVAAPDDYGLIETVQLLAAVALEQREALVLTQIIGLSYADAAEVVGCPVGTIRSRVARGRDALALAMELPRRQAEGEQ